MMGWLEREGRLQPNLTLLQISGEAGWLIHWGDVDNALLVRAQNGNRGVSFVSLPTIVMEWPCVLWNCLCSGRESTRPAGSARPAHTVRA